LSRTKWKRQTAVSLEFLEQQGNIAAVHRLLQQHHMSAGIVNPHPSLWYSPYMATTAAVDALYSQQKRSAIDVNKLNCDSLSSLTSITMSPNKSV
jgi:hypothetical protein